MNYKYKLNLKNFENIFEKNKLTFLTLVNKVVNPN